MPAPGRTQEEVAAVPASGGNQEEVAAVPAPGGNQEKVAEVPAPGGDVDIFTTPASASQAPRLQAAAATPPFTELLAPPGQPVALVPLGSNALPLSTHQSIEVEGSTSSLFAMAGSHMEEQPGDVDGSPAPAQARMPSMPWPYRYIPASGGNVA